MHRIRSSMQVLIVALGIVACAHAIDLRSVSAACQQTYIEGMTPEIASALGREAVPFLHQLLLDETFPRPDNIVAYLAYLGDESSPKALFAYATRPQAAKLTTPDQIRAVLLVGHALGRLAGAQVPGALDILHTLSVPTSNMPNAPHLAREALFGMALAADYSGLVNAVKTTQRTISLDPAQSIDGAIAAEIVGAFSQILHEGVPKEILAQYPDLDKYGVKVAVTPSGEFAQPPDVDLDGVLSLVYGAPATDGAAARARRGAGKTWSITFCNHVSTSNKVTSAQCDSILAAGTSYLKTANFAGDVACDATLSRSGGAGSFGSAGDSLSTINTNAALTSVLNNGCGRVKVVNAINFCGGSSGTNIIGCGWKPGNGIAVVRYGTTNQEGVLWTHEFGHNLGLSHSSDYRNIMYGSINTYGGVTSAQCAVFNPPPPPPPPSCFATDGEVEVQGRGRVRMDSLQQGDMVADGSEQGFSRFVTYLHFDGNSSSPFIALSLDAQSSPLLLTPAHYVFIADAQDGMKSVRADQVTIGDRVFVGSDRTAAVSSIRNHTQHGVVGPLTESGQILANGIVASCYSDVINTPHETAHTVMKPLIWLSRMFPSLARHDVSHSDIHWYAQVLVKLAQMGDHVQDKIDQFRALLPAKQ